MIEAVKFLINISQLRPYARFEDIINICSVINRLNQDCLVVKPLKLLFSRGIQCKG